MLYREFYCTGCRKRLRVAAELVRPRVRCKRCGAIFRIPRGSDLRWGKPSSRMSYPSKN